MDTEETGKLYLCPTPIGNLGDITERVLEILQTVDVIAAEDTRNTLRLLNHFHIRTALTSYHEHNKHEKADDLVESMLTGKTIALVTDAGTPAISDPGEILVKKAIESGIEVISLPGATAFVTALTASGLPARRFVFEGFLPKAKKEKRKILEEISKEKRTIILYEAPHHLKDTLRDICDVLGGERQIALCRELTKLHEEILRLTTAEAAEYYNDREPRGEYVLVIAGKPQEEEDSDRKKEYGGLNIREHLAMYEAAGLDRKDAMKRVAKDRGISKRDVYSALLT